MSRGTVLVLAIYFNIATGVSFVWSARRGDIQRDSVTESSTFNNEAVIGIKKDKTYHHNTQDPTYKDDEDTHQYTTTSDSRKQDSSGNKILSVNRYNNDDNLQTRYDDKIEGKYHGNDNTPVNSGRRYDEGVSLQTHVGGRNEEGLGKKHQLGGAQSPYDRSNEEKYHQKDNSIINPRTRYNGDTSLQIHVGSRYEEGYLRKDHIEISSDSMYNKDNGSQDPYDKLHDPNVHGNHNRNMHSSTKYNEGESLQSNFDGRNKEGQRIDHNVYGNSGLLYSEHSNYNGERPSTYNIQDHYRNTDIYDRTGSRRTHWGRENDRNNGDKDRAIPVYGTKSYGTKRNKGKFYKRGRYNKCRGHSSTGGSKKYSNYRTRKYDKSRPFIRSSSKHSRYNKYHGNRYSKYNKKMY